MHLAESFPPRKKLLELGLIRETQPNWFKTTEAGRKYLESLSNLVKS